VRRAFRFAACTSLLLGVAAPQATAQSTRKPVVVGFSAAQRAIAAGYFLSDHGHGQCPNGLVKANGACLLAGQSRKRYSVGQVLPPGVVPKPLPPEFTRHLGAPEPGYSFGIVDGDLVMLAGDSTLVVDAVSSFVP
jgi:hypothetical protein